MARPTTKKIVDSIIEIFRMLEDGDAKADELRKRASELPGNEGRCQMLWIDLAEILHRCPDQAPAIVKNPRYRRGTGRQPTAWSNCLWKPPEIRS